MGSLLDGKGPLRHFQVLWSEQGTVCETLEKDTMSDQDPSGKSTFELPGHEDSRTMGS